MTGIVGQPFNGVMHEGAEGFFKGVGKGLIGVVVKPVVGVLDLFTNTSEGLRNATTTADLACTGSRRRFPRNIGPDGVIETFSESKAEGHFMLNVLCDGKYSDESYLFHIPLNKEVLLATTSHLFYFKKENYDYTLLWKASPHRISQVECDIATKTLTIHSHKEEELKKKPLVIVCPNEKTMEACFVELDSILTYAKLA